MRHYIYLFAILSFNLGCETLLDKEPLAVVSENSAYQSEGDALKALTSVYNTLLNYPGYDGYSIYDIAADNAEKGGEGPSDGGYFNEIAYFTLTSSNTVALQVWRNAYLGIRRANLVIENVPDIDMDENRRARIVGEGKFLRAYNYFILVSLFGDVPLITELEYEREAIVRDPKDLVYAQIIKDLKEAADVLPLRTELEADELGRITQGAAQAYLGKVYLYQQNFPEAEAWFRTVIASNQYGLEEDYYRIFTMAGEFSSENIFEINHIYNAQYLTARNLSNIRQGSAGMYGYGFVNPTQDFVDAFEPGDPRLWQTVYADGQVLPDGKIADVGNSETGYMNKKAYLMEGEFPPTGDAGHSGKNEIKLRYGMLLLWYAEAANKNGNFEVAVTALNDVRRRARQGNPDVLPDVQFLNQNQLEKAIWHEQRVEYGMENHRFFDLVRQGRAGDVLRNYAARYNTVKGRNFRDGINELFPIPQTEIDLSQGKLAQNFGY